MIFSWRLFLLTLKSEHGEILRDLTISLLTEIHIFNNNVKFHDHMKNRYLTFTSA